MATRAMILAAGRGERMRPLTDTAPKPMLTVGAKPLLQFHIENLVAAGITDIVINHAWLGEQIEAYFGDGARFGCHICYSKESPALETGGAITKVLPFFKNEPFWVVNGDVFCPFAHFDDTLQPGQLANLYLVDNPEHNPNGDLGQRDGLICYQADNKLTFSGIGLYHPALFSGTKIENYRLPALWPEAAKQGLLSAKTITSYWCDVGTPERLEALRDKYDTL